MSAHDGFGRLDHLAAHVGRARAAVSALDFAAVSEGERSAIRHGLIGLMAQLRYQVINDRRMAEREGRLAEQVRRQAALDLELADLRARIERLEKRADDHGGAR